MINYIIKIQSVYRGYKKRKYINNFYKKLPCDIQAEVLYIIKKDFYIERCNKKLDFIITKKINRYFIDFNNKLNIDFNQQFNLLNYINNNNKNILHIFKLFAKYSYIIKDKLIIYNKLIDNLNIIRNVLNNYEKKIFNAYTNNVFKRVNSLYRIILKIIP